MDQHTYDKGLAIRTAVLGEEYVRKAAGNVDAFSKPLQDLVTEYCWGAVLGPRGPGTEDPQHAEPGDDRGAEPAERAEHTSAVPSPTASPAKRSVRPSCKWASTRASRPRSTASGWPGPCSPNSTRARQPMSDPIGFIGLGNMGFPMMSRLLAAGHPVVVFDVREDVRTEATALGARAAESVRAVADQAKTVLASLPTPQVSEAVVADIAAGSAIRRFIDLSTVGGQAAQRNHAVLDARYRRTGQSGQRWCARRPGRHARSDGVRATQRVRRAGAGFRGARPGDLRVRTAGAAADHEADQQSDGRRSPWPRPPR